MDALKDYDVDGHVCDVGNQKDREQLINKIGETYGRIDVLVLNVANSSFWGMQLDITENDFDKMFNINVKGTFFAIKEAKPWLDLGENPNILVISSVVGAYPSNALGVYSMTKAALNNMVKFLSVELRCDGIRINAIAPGLIKTRFARNVWSNPNFDKEKVGKPEDIGAMAATLCSEDGVFCNGEIFHVHGGFSSL
jgi:dehydrogenase/reductase SDR family member 4